MFDSPEMYTEEGDQAVIRAMIVVANMAETDLTIRNKETLWKSAEPIIKAVGNLYYEIYDTEPRHWIEDQLDAICKAHGWAYNEFEGWM